MKFINKKFLISSLTLSIFLVLLIDFQNVFKVLDVLEEVNFGDLKSEIKKKHSKDQGVKFTEKHIFLQFNNNETEIDLYFGPGNKLASIEIYLEEIYLRETKKRILEYFIRKKISNEVQFTIENFNSNLFITLNMSKYNVFPATKCD